MLALWTLVEDRLSLVRRPQLKRVELETLVSAFWAVVLDDLSLLLHLLLQLRLLLNNRVNPVLPLPISVSRKS